jgi:hypothetical protein
MENSESPTIEAPTATSAPETPTPASEAPSASPTPAAEAVPKPRGRPHGSKDRQPRTRRPTIRVEPVPPRAEAAVAAPAPRERLPQTAPPPSPAPEPEHVEAPEEPPSPRTLYRETSQRLVHLRGMLNESRRAAAADKYTSKLYTWAA